MPSKRRLSVAILYRTRQIVLKMIMGFRILWYRLLGAKIGKKVKLASVFMPVPEQVIIGDNCNIEDNVRLRAGGPWKSSSISIGNNTYIGHSSQINVRTEFKIGSNCLIAPLCVFGDAHHSFENLDMPIKDQPTSSLPISVEDNVWIGTGSIVLGGVTIHSGAIIAAGAVVNTSVPENEIWGGVPARKLKSRTQEVLK